MKFKNFKYTFFAALFMVLVVTSASSAAKSYEIDVSHSTLGFAVKHLQVSTTRGSFNQYSGSISFDKDDLSNFAADVSIEVGSIDTDNEARDKHLRSSDFFDAENHANIIFDQARLEKRGEGTVIVGNLTIKGITKEVTIPVTISGPVQSPFGSEVIGIAGQTFINRQDFGVSWNKAMDQGGFVVDDVVNLIIEIEAHNKS